MSGKIPHVLIKDNDGSIYLIQESENKNFFAWIAACEAGNFSKMKEFARFNKNRIDLPKLVIYEWEEKA